MYNNVVEWILVFTFTLFINGVWASATAISSFERAKRHSIVQSKPAPNFFAGAVLGNGGLGAIVTTRPDAIVIHFGHNNVWDIRLAEDNREKIGTFNEVYNRIKSIPDDIADLEEDAWYREYRRMARENYSKPYPRPFPCGTIVLGFDRREVELLGHRLDISDGLCDIDLLVNGKPHKVQVCIEMTTDRLWMRLVDEVGDPAINCFQRVRILPDPATPSEFPPLTTIVDDETHLLSFMQVMPYQEPAEYDIDRGHPGDHAFRLTARVSCPLTIKSRPGWSGNDVNMGALERGLGNCDQFVMCAQLDEGLAADLKVRSATAPQPNGRAFEDAINGSREVWRDYWNCSGVQLGDAFLEQIWYRNLYFLNCAVRAGVTCPGLFANWSYDAIGSAWHGDYHFNYNLQQPFWVTFSSNHLDKNLPYVDLIDHVLPMSKRWAREYYGLVGAYFPHSAYPVDMSMNPYPVPTWGWEVCETPWAVQSLWWHYLYSMDEAFLQERAYQPIKEAVLFLIDYMKRPEAHGAEWGDDRYHIFPTVSPELYGLKPGFRFNHDCLVDLTLTKFVFRAFLRAAEILNICGCEAALIDDIEDILTHFPEIPTAVSEKYGVVYVSVPGEHPEMVYNVPNSLMTVFPGEEHGLHTDGETMTILSNTFKNFQVEGGNELVFQHLQAARLGLLDLERFKRQIRYCLLPNGTAADMVLQVHGRYSDRTKYDFMTPMGIWFENFSLPVVINECLMQSYNGLIRLYPNWPDNVDARFSSLRAVGAFLVSAKKSKNGVDWVEIVSEVGTPLKMINPWRTAVLLRNGAEKSLISDLIIHIDTEKGDKLLFSEHK